VRCPHVASRPLNGSEPNLARLVASLTLSPTPNLKSIDIQLCLWRRVEVSRFSTTTADAINTAKPCRAACEWLDERLFTIAGLPDMLSDHRQSLAVLMAYVVVVLKHETSTLCKSHNFISIDFKFGVVDNVREVTSPAKVVRV